MDERNSLFELSGLPEGFGVVLLVFSLALVLAPYMAGVDFGIFKVPELGRQTKKSLRIVGPVIFSAALLTFIPHWPVQRVISPEEPTEQDPPQPGGSDSLNGKTSANQLPSYRFATILMPASLSNASVKVDNEPATIIEQTPITATIRVRAKESNHRISIEKDGRVCTKEQLIREEQHPITFTLQDCN